MTSAGLLVSNKQGFKIAFFLIFIFVGQGDGNNNKSGDMLRSEKDILNNEKKFLKVEKATNEQIVMIAPAGPTKALYEAKLIGMKDMILVSWKPFLKGFDQAVIILID